MIARRPTIGSACVRAPLSRAMRLAFVSGLSLTGASAACSKAPTDQFVAGLSTQVQVPRDLQSIVVRISKANQNLFCKSYPVIDGKARLPQSLGTALQVDTDRLIPLEIRVLGIQATDASHPELFTDDCGSSTTFGKGQTRVLRRAVEQYSEGRKLYIAMPLMYSCFDVKCDGPTDTCGAGVCKTAVPRAAGVLREYVPNQELGEDNLCFRIKTRDGVPGCMDAQVPPKILDKATCLYELPTLDGVPFKGINVNAFFEGGYVHEVLDADKDEGFFIPDANKPQQFQLAPGLCTLAKLDPASPNGHAITAITASGLCAAKTQNQAICSGDIQEITAVSSTSNVGGPGKVLVPTKGALVLVMDRSSNNKTVFDAGGLAQSFIDFGLSDPSLKRISMGTLTLPATPESCSIPSLSSTIQAGDAGKNGVSQILNALIAAKNFPVLDGSKLGLDAALTKVYADLADQPSDIDRRSVVVLGNGPFASTCSASTSIVTLATSALNTNKIQTSVVLSGDDTSKDTIGADALASAGGTVSSKSALGAKDTATAAGLLAFADIVTELTTCRYDVSTVTAEASQKVAFFSSDKQGEQVLDFAATCSTGEGWTKQGSTLVLCPTPCTALRHSQKLTILKAVTEGQTYSPIPIYLREPAVN